MLHQTAFEMDMETDSLPGVGEAKSSLGGVSDAKCAICNSVSYPAKLNHLIRIYGEDQNI